jgi:hypothetical protein
VVAAAGLVAALAVIVSYVPHFSGDFVWDDKVYLLENPRFARGESLLPILEHPLAGQVFRPISTATLWLQVQLHGFSMVGFRAAQLAIHFACGAALFLWLGRRLLSSSAAAIGAAVFLVHPAATEGVMFANARHDVLGALFAWLALLAADDGKSLRGGLVAGLFSLLAVGCKESFVVLGPLLAVQVLALSHGDHLGRRVAIAGLPSLAGAAIVFAVRRALGVSASSGIEAGPRELGRAFAALLAHHGRAFVTFSDAPTAERYVALDAPSTWLVSILASSAFAALAWRAWRGGATFSTAWIGASVLLLGLLPSIAAVPATGQYGNRYGYFALAGFATLVATVAVPVVARIGTRSALVRRLSLATALVAVVVVALETSARAGNWHEGLSLFGADVDRFPDDSRANYHYGVEIVATTGCADALPYFERAVAAEPDWPRALRNVAACELRLGRPREALEPARRAAALEPNEAAHRRNLAAALFATGQIEAAQSELAEAERLAPGAPQNRR